MSAKDRKGERQYMCESVEAALSKKPLAEPVCFIGKKKKKKKLDENFNKIYF